MRFDGIELDASSLKKSVPTVLRSYVALVRVFQVATQPVAW